MQVKIEITAMQVIAVITAITVKHVTTILTAFAVSL